MGFFQVHSALSDRMPMLIPKCGACGIYKGCNSPKMSVSGGGQRGILVLAEAPGGVEDDEGTQFVGPTGQLLRRAFDRLGVSLDEDCWKTNALICRPPSNRAPTSQEIDYCRPNLLRALRDCQPRLVIPLGAAAVKSLIGPLWREDVGLISQWVGWKIPLQRGNFWIAPNYHPSYVSRSEGEKNGAVVKIWFDRYLEEALSLSGRPWEDVPDYGSLVDVILNPEEASDRIDKMVHAGGAVSFDFETNMLKPDSADARIISCSVCWKGIETISYPWAGSAIGATGRLLRSDLPKIGANTKFEDRWCRRFFGVGVRNFVWDVMLSSHHLDNRRGITSVKFQAFVRLGQRPWDSEMKQYFESTDERGVNRISEVDLRSLLVYGGMDALMEYKLAEIQKKEMLQK